MLSCDGNIYAFGENSCGVVGNGDREPQILPIKLENEKKFNDIASHPYFRISMSLSDENKEETPNPIDLWPPHLSHHISRPISIDKSHRVLQKLYCTK